MCAQPTAQDWSALLRAHAKQGDLAGAGAVCGAMGEAGVPADAAAYTALARVYMLHRDAAAIVRPVPWKPWKPPVQPHCVCARPVCLWCWLLECAPLIHSTCGLCRDMPDLSRNS